VQASLLLLGLQAVAAVLHAVPGLVYPSRTGRTTTRLVAYIQDLGPLWVLAFGVSSLLLGGLLWRGRGVHYGHLGCAAVWVMYVVALWIGALADTPHGTVFYPVVTTIVFSFHLLLAASYNEDAERRR
jgi:hypothetical protein